MKKANLKRRHLDEAYAEAGVFNARCQVCGQLMARGEADWCHLRHEGMGGGIARTVKSNGVMAHRRCHQWMDRVRARLETAIASGANLINLEVIEWETKQKLRLWRWLIKGVDEFRAE